MSYDPRHYYGRLAVWLSYDANVATACGIASWYLWGMVTAGVIYLMFS